MRGLVAAILIVSAAMTVGSATPAAAVCSVFDKRPCAPTVCGVYQRRPCIPEIDYPIGQDLRLTVESPPAEGAASLTLDQNDSSDEHKLNTLSAMFAALRGCWVPPPAADAHHGMQMSVRLSFKRTGEIIGTPRVTYTSPNTPPEVRDLFYNAITAALERCSPMPFTTDWLELLPAAHRHPFCRQPMEQP